MLSLWGSLNSGSLSSTFLSCKIAVRRRHSARTGEDRGVINRRFLLGIFGALLLVGCKHSKPENISTLPSIGSAAKNAEYVGISLPEYQVGECRSQLGPEVGEWRL